MKKQDSAEKTNVMVVRGRARRPAGRTRDDPQSLTNFVRLYDTMACSNHHINSERHLNGPFIFPKSSGFCLDWSVKPPTQSQPTRLLVFALAGRMCTGLSHFHAATMMLWTAVSSSHVKSQSAVVGFRDVHFSNELYFPAGSFY